jgi:hypothetical protein
MGFSKEQAKQESAESVALFVGNPRLDWMTSIQSPAKAAQVEPRSRWPTPGAGGTAELERSRRNDRRPLLGHQSDASEPTAYFVPDVKKR